MSTVTEGDLKRLEDLITGLAQRIEQRFDAVESRLDRLETKVQDLAISVVKIESKVDGLEKRIDDTIKPIDSVDARLNTFTIGFFSIFGVFVTGVLTVIGKIVFFPNP
ncbi:DUF4164 domain-containing protein [Chroococcus sp. FPU101]|uniref:DUF4164 domain-containing protein n=1 Tax=Chroococcus sp. FPU101 TaxID=1974212 RepID=UPI001A8DBDC4|nr:DUF4164 domain-containing protein [Chroococcus sp. FPU101]GFE68574.1 unknown protein [Chroococcus sp. FPU101]